MRLSVVIPAADKVTTQDHPRNRGSTASRPASVTADECLHDLGALRPDDSSGDFAIARNLRATGQCPVPPLANRRSRARPARGVVGRRARPLSSAEITAHCVAVEACVLELAHDHADVLLAEVLSPLTRNRHEDAGFVAEAPMARGLAVEFGEAVMPRAGAARAPTGRQS
jgi:hypothetical protein